MIYSSLKLSEINAAIRAAGCRDEYRPAMNCIVVSLLPQGDRLDDIIQKWKVLKPHFWKQP